MKIKYIYLLQTISFFIAIVLCKHYFVENKADYLFGVQIGGFFGMTLYQTIYSFIKKENN